MTKLLTANEIHEITGYLPTTLKNWARKGYPCMINGANKKVRLIGAKKVGGEWYFNLEALENFINNMDDERWVYSNQNILQKKEKKNGKTGYMTSATEYVIQERLAAKVSERKRMH